MRPAPACAVLAIYLLAAPVSLAEQAHILPPSEQDRFMTDLCSALSENYVFQEKVAPLCETLRQTFEDKANRQRAPAHQFAADVTRDLINASGDYHFSVEYDPGWVAQARNTEAAGDKTELREDSIAALQTSNFGFRELSILEGNIGYIRFDFFPDPEHSFDAAAAAMQFVEHADAIIFDMRYNRGGHNQFGQFLSSYLFGADENRLLLEYRFMQEGEMKEGAYWTAPALPGPRRPDVPVYILTSSTTFSAGEWFAYALQKLGRATVVGMTTAGASHAVSRVPIDDRFVLQVPVGQVMDPVDRGDFEGTGVRPDIETPSYRARDYAHMLALEAVAAQDGAAGPDPDWLKPVLAARMDPPQLSAAELERFSGQYEGRSIALEGTRLIYTWRGRFNLALAPLGGGVFAVEGTDDFRFRFKEANGRISTLERLDRNGQTTSYSRLE